MPPEGGAVAAPIIVTALLGPADHAWLDGLRRVHFPPGRNLLSAHLTLFHHLPPSAEPELRRRLSDLADEPEPRAETGGLMNLGNGVAVRIASPALAEIRATLAEAFALLLTPQDRAGWRPHVTIQNKVASAEARTLLRTLSADFAVARPIRISGLASWHYLGGPWEPLSRHMFRGAR